MQFKLPPSLEPYRAEFEKTALDYIGISKAEGKPQLWESKLSGYPYLPRNAQFPKNSKGEHLLFLAQINFEEALPLKPFPTSGLLQFFISGDDLYGKKFRKEYDKQDFLQDGFRIIYFDEVTKNVDDLSTDFSFLPEEYKYTPHDPTKEYKLQFELKKELVSFNDFHFENNLKKLFLENFNGEQAEKLREAYNDIYQSTGHKMGGYAYFTQTDPREYDQSIQHLMLLLQIDTDDSMDIMWGDVGVANFFIDPKKLAQKDFSEVMYNWDCC